MVQEVSTQKNRVEEINENIDIYLGKFEEEAKLLDGIPGISKVAAAAIIGEIGTDMSKFPKVENICSWAGLAPGCNESAGKKNQQRQGTVIPI